MLVLFSITHNVSQVWLVADLITKTMIEKIDKIRDLLIVPSVDEQPKMAITELFRLLLHLGHISSILDGLADKR